MKVRAKRFVGAILIYILGVVCIATGSYWMERQRYLQDIDARLLAAASNIPSILPADFHDIARTPEAISAEQDKFNLELMSRHTRSGDLTYLYSYVMVDGMIYFTSCNYTKEDVEKDQVVTYWTSYPEGSPEYFEAMSATEPVYVTAGDRWGLFRTILMPLKSPGGLPYVVAADMDITVIEQSLLRSVLSVIGLSIVLLFIVTPLIFAYRRTYSEMNFELRGLNKQLQEDIDQAMILEAELKEATIKANTANEIKSQFLSNMSHELRTPINGVVGMNQLLMDTELTSVQREYTRLCNQSAHVLLDTVNQILDVATIEAQGLTTHPKPLSCEAYFNDVVSLFASQVAEKRLDLVLHLDNGIPAEIKMDPFRLRQVLINLISNAIKFTCKGGIRITLGWKNGVLSGEVKDSGIGIPQNAQQRVFETFQQVDNSSSRQYGGTGLGLPISQQICRVMGGDLSLKHSDDNGSTFIFHVAAPAISHSFIAPLVLPADESIVVLTDSGLLNDWLKTELMNSLNCQLASNLDDAVLAMDDHHLMLVDAKMGIDALKQLSESIDLNKKRLIWLAWFGQKLPPELTDKVEVLRKPLLRASLLNLFQVQTDQGPANEPHFSGRVLVVDDNPANLKGMGDQLKYTGLIVDLVENGPDALSACLTKSYDLVLMDVQMPGMNGLDATRHICTELGQKAPPIVGVSALVLKENRDNAKEAGMSGYLDKPVTKEQLLEKVAEFLK